MYLILAAFYFGVHTEIRDIDFEYPETKDDATAFTSLLTDMRTALNQLASRKGDSVPYVLSVRVLSLDFALNDADDGVQIAVSAVPYYYQNLNIRQIDAVLDFWNLMASSKVLCLSVHVA